jgi:NAD(P)-dependent dehydrogenase (short-subunit alcohol dehydrogenase family)
MQQALQGRVALVAGATRGSGRAIAVCLGAAGATVYCTGRSVRGRSAMAGRPEAIEDTAEQVTRRGGRGIAVPVDHTDAAQVQRLVERIDREQGHLDILVNDIWGGDELSEWGKRFWEQSLEKGFQLLQRAVHTHIITSRHAVPLMLQGLVPGPPGGQAPGPTGGRAGLVIEVGDGDGYWYRENFFYDLAKVTVLRMAWTMAQELRPHGFAALAITPGFLRSEAMLDHFGVTEATWRDAVAQDRHFAQSETPYFLGRAVAALAADPAVLRKTGGSFNSGALAEEYGFTDVDGRKPHWMRYAREALPELFRDPFKPG